VRLFAGHELENGEEIDHASARFYALQSVRNCANAVSVTYEMHYTLQRQGMRGLRHPCQTSLYPLWRYLGSEATFLSSHECISAMIAGHTWCVFPRCL
jgi:hypothetical protein